MESNRPQDLADVFENLVRGQIELWNAVDATLQRELDLPVAIHQPLRVIAAAGEARVGDIAEALVITVGGASKIVDRLESRGLIERRANPADRRSSWLALTDTGIATLTRADAVVEAELRELLLQPLGAERVAALGEALVILRTTITREDHS